MTLYKWSQIASADATADSTINWTEGQSPSSVNDSARAMMAAIAKYRDDVAGAIVTSGTSTSYAVNTYQAFQSLGQLNGQVIAFTPHTTNGAGSPNVTLNVDGLGAKSIQCSPGVEIPAGTLIQGSPYVAFYSASNGIFYLQNFFGNPYNVPIGASIEFWGSTAPNSSFALMYGQAVSRTTYATLFSLLGTTYGPGDGSATFNIPDLRGRVVAGRDDMGGSAASRLTSTYFGASAASLGAAGGSQSHTLALAELPTGIASSGTNSISVNSIDSDVWQGPPDGRNPASGNTFGITTLGGSRKTITSTGSSSISVMSNNTGGGAHAIVPPTIIANKLLRII